MKKSPHQMLATLAMLLALAVVEQQARAVVPAPDGCYANFTTAEGCNALQSLTAGVGNTGLGWRSLFSDNTGSFNTGVGAGALVLNSVDDNTAVGAVALFLNTTGTENTAVGTGALELNDTGNLNTAVGAFALSSHQTGPFNNAFGTSALGSDQSGGSNNAFGHEALNSNISGSENAAVGDLALVHSTGNQNTAIGFDAGGGLAAGDGNVYIGAETGPGFNSTESNHTYVRNINTTSVNGGGTDGVTVDLTTGLIGHASSSRRYKNDIQAMDTASQAVFLLKPVSFRYKKEIDHSQTLDYGLIAEEVAQVDPNLAIRDRNGQVESVRYNAINAMLLNEFLKEHKAFLEEQKKVRKLEAALATVDERLKEQDAKIEKVSSGIEANVSAPHVARVP